MRRGFYPIITGIIVQLLARYLFDATSGEAFIAFMIGWIIGYLMTNEKKSPD